MSCSGYPHDGTIIHIAANMQNQFDYDYPEAELKEWVDQRIIRMACRAKTGLLFFNNHVRAQAPRNAQTLIHLLTDAGLTVV